MIHNLRGNLDTQIKLALFSELIITLDELFKRAKTLESLNDALVFNSYLNINGKEVDLHSYNLKDIKKIILLQLASDKHEVQSLTNQNVLDVVLGVEDNTLNTSATEDLTQIINRGNCILRISDDSFKVLTKKGIEMVNINYDRKFIPEVLKILANKSIKKENVVNGGKGTINFDSNVVLKLEGESLNLWINLRSS